jgi:peptidoglycan/LPS O-acetylase OafA/YrhL
MNRIPSLDGWRGIAILLVLFDHVQRMLLGHFLVAWTETGQYGVTVFFVLSGFLITATLLGQPINLRCFYTRRLFRLMPVAWTYLVFVGIFGLLSGVNWFSWCEILSCILFFRNYVIINGHGLASGHFWSLSIEEQFYLVWPTFLLLAGRRRALWGAVCGILACTIVR